MKYFLLFALLLGGPAWAALPPQSAAELRKEANNVITGTVARIDSRVIQREVGSDRVYTLTLMIDAQSKGSLSSDSIRIECWKPFQRPEGWVGPQGQNEIPKEKQKIRVYLKRGPGGTMEMLQPNGWESI